MYPKIKSKNLPNTEYSFSQVMRRAGRLGICLKDLFVTNYWKQNFTDLQTPSEFHGKIQYKEAIPSLKFPNGSVGWGKNKVDIQPKDTTTQSHQELINDLN